MTTPSVSPSHLPADWQPFRQPDQEGCWRLVLAAAELARNPRAMPDRETGFAFARNGQMQPVDAKTPAWLYWRPGLGWRCADSLLASAREFVELYLPLCQPLATATRIVAHLGQSLDGCIATHTGDSERVTGPDNIRHLHRMRALSDAVIVGAGTVASDDPRLTTRLVFGAHAVRVVLDPEARLDAEYRLFHDGEAPTLLVRAGRTSKAAPGRAEALDMPMSDGVPDLAGLVAVLAQRGLRRLFVEGGGVTVSEFLVAGLLDRLQIAVAPLIIGRGRAGVTLPACDAMAQTLRPPVRLYQTGDDVLYDFDLSPGVARRAVTAGIRRIG